MAKTGVIYLDIDDEITSAASRIRTIDARRVAVVLPYGSRVATSRINFRLLARDALTNEKRLSIVAGDPATRALAASAGLPVFSSVGEYEASEEGSGGVVDAGAGAGGAIAGAAAAGAVGTGAIATDRPTLGLDGSATVVTGDAPPPAGVPKAKPARSKAAPEGAGAAVEPSAAAAAGAGAIGLDASATTVSAPVPASVPSPPQERRRPRPVAVPADELPLVADETSYPGTSGGAPRVDRVSRPAGRGRSRTPILLGLAVVGLAALVVGVAAFLLLPSATIAITPREETLSPVSFVVTASTTATEPDAEAGIVPAELVEDDVSVTDSFPATGKRVEEKTATGQVRFQNLDFTSTNSIAKGAVVSTESGIRFRTDRAVTVPAAQSINLTVVPATATVSVTAVDAGPESNVAENTINAVPRGENPLFLKVSNPDPTSGGSREEFPRVTQADVDAAVAALTDRLTAAWADRLEDPDLGGGVATVFTDTATLSEPEFSAEPDTLVGSEVESFELGASAHGTVTAVDASPVERIAEDRLASRIDADHVLVEGSRDIQVAPAEVTDGVISFPVTVTARQVPILDPAAIEAEILGRSLADAQTILERYGTVSLEVWPDWVATIPTLDLRVTVSVDGPTRSASPDDGATAAPESTG